MKLLVVDDDADVLDAILAVLEDAGFAVMQASSGEDAIAKAATAMPDVLVTDLDLGSGMNGIELAAEARRRWPSLPIVYISGRQWLLNEHRLGTGEAFLAKPFRQRDLVGRVRAVAAKVH